MKSLRILTLVTIALLLAPMLSAADFGVRAGRYNDGDENFVGAEVLFDLGAINVNPNIEYSLADNITAGTVNVDLTYDVASIGGITPYIGAGLGLSYVDDVDTRTDILGNLIGGVSFNLASLKPYAQVKYFRVLEDDAGDAEDDIALTIGLRF
ncbi:MAG: P44/Msp2 family outer membrane protein [Thermoanaerobaculia bacterium]